MIKRIHVIRKEVMWSSDIFMTYISNISDIQEILMNNRLFKFKLKNNYGDLKMKNDV